MGEGASLLGPRGTRSFNQQPALVPPPDKAMNDPDSLIWPAADFSRVPYPVFLDQGVYEREQARIFQGPVWCFLAFEAEVPLPGDFKCVFVGDAPVVVTRAEDGSVCAFLNSCSHKGTRLVREPRGNAASHTCIYHHWCFDPKGNLIGVPFQRGVGGHGGMPESFDRARHGLRTLKTASYRGLVFGSFDADVEPLEEYLDRPVLDFLDRYLSKPIEVLGQLRQRLPSNWKAYWENVADGYHSGLLHQLPVIFGIHRLTHEAGMVFDKRGRHHVDHVVIDTDTPEAAAEGYGEVVHGAKIASPLKLADTAIIDWRDEIGDGRSVMVLAVFPNLLVHQLSNTMATRQIRTTSADEFEVYWTFFGYADDDPELRRMRLVQMGMLGPGGIISIEDGESGVLIQRGMRGSPNAHTVIEMGGTGAIADQDYITTEVPVRGFWRHYCDLMGFRTQARRPAA